MRTENDEPESWFTQGGGSFEEARARYELRRQQRDQRVPAMRSPAPETTPEVRRIAEMYAAGTITRGTRDEMLAAAGHGPKPTFTDAVKRLAQDAAPKSTFNDALQRLAEIAAPIAPPNSFEKRSNK